jgi:hypothetical protein
VYPFRLEIPHLDRVLASQPRCNGRAQSIFALRPSLPLLEQRPGVVAHANPMRRWREGWPPVYKELFARSRADRREGYGVREFVRILRRHREHPADQVEDVIGVALRSGCAHTEGVTLCLHQRQQPAAPVAALERPAQPHLTMIGRQPVDLNGYEQRLLGRSPWKRPSAYLTIFLDNGIFQSAVVIGTNALHEFSDCKGAHGFSHSPLAMHPLGFNRVQPGTLAG